jgi:hydroxyacyl-ACP dehydratase HTD2-like protein with hotdog domain
MVALSPVVGGVVMELLHIESALAIHGVRQIVNERDVIAVFRFRAQRPVFDSAPFSVCGKRESDTLVLWIANDQGELCMSATARLS